MDGFPVLGVVGEPDNAVRYVRFYQPFEHLVDRGFELRTLGSSLTLTRGPDGFEPAEELLDGVSLVIFPQIVLSPQLPDGSRVRLVEPLCAMARRRGIPIVYSPDDYLAGIEPTNPEFERIADSAGNLASLLSLADAFVVTTEALRESLAAMGRPIHVIPNAIDPRRCVPRPRRSGELRLGWAGSSSHVEDLLRVLPAIRALQRRVPVRFCILGLVDRPIEELAREVRGLSGLSAARRTTAERFLELAGELRSIDHLHQPFGSLESYFGRLAALDLDVGICPLLDTRFNRHRSALKFYEYAAAGSMTVASAVGPYRDEVSVTVDDPADWADVLEPFLRDETRREAELVAQRAFVMRERNIETVRHLWAAALLDIRRRDPAPSVDSRPLHRTVS